VDRFCNPFFEEVQKTCQVHFSYLFRLVKFLFRATGQAKVPAEVLENSWVLRARRLCTQPPIASTPGSSPPERPGPDKSTSQPCFDPTCPCNTTFQQKERGKAEVCTSRGGTGTRCVRPLLTRVLSRPRRSGEDEPGVEAIRSCVHTRRALNTRLSSGTSAGIFACPAGPYRNCRGEAGTKNEPKWYFVPIQKKGWKVDPHVST